MCHHSFNGGTGIHGIILLSIPLIVIFQKSYILLYIDIYDRGGENGHNVLPKTILIFNWRILKALYLLRIYLTCNELLT
jgi:hypothetical protein